MVKCVFVEKEASYKNNLEDKKNGFLMLILINVQTGKDCSDELFMTALEQFIVNL